LDLPDDGDPGNDILIPISPEWMLLFCLAFGFAVSSFAHRRQDRDPFQTVVYITVLVPVAVWGYHETSDARLVLLELIPLATCVAMIISITVHSLYRHLRSSIRVFGDEKRRISIQSDCTY
jgi:ABC-type polysaccharide/polyol phosphate export permease